MEIIIALVVLGFGLWWFFLRTPANTTSTAPYKVETPPTPEPAPVVEDLADIAIAQQPVAVEEVVVLAPMEAAPAKKPRKPRAPKAVVPAEKPVAKKAAPKKAAAIKAAPKKPTTPRSKKA